MKRNAPIKTTKNCDYILNWEDTNKRMTIDGLCTIQDEHGLVAVKISASTKLHSIVNESDYVHAGMILVIQFYEWNQESVILRRLDYSNTNEIYMSISYEEICKISSPKKFQNSFLIYFLLDTIVTSYYSR